MIATMKWFGLAFWLLLGFTEGQNGGIDPQCNIIAEEVLQLKQPLIDQLKAFDADFKFQDNWYSVFHDDCFYYDDGMCFDYSQDRDSYGRAFRESVKPFQVKGEMLNATLNVAGIISSHDLKLQQYEKRKFELLNRYYYRGYSEYNSPLKPFGIFISEFVDNYDSLASASRCEPCTDANEFSLCLYKELNEINEGLAIFQEVAVSRRPVLLADTIDLLIKEFEKFPNITNEQIFDFYKNTVFIREETRYIRALEDRYRFDLESSVKDFANEFTQLVQTILEPACTQRSCVGNVLKELIPQIKPYLTPIAKTLPKWNNYYMVVPYYVQPENLTGINLIIRFEAGFAAYGNYLFPRDRDGNPLHYPVAGMMDAIIRRRLNNPYSDHIMYIVKKGLKDLQKCPDYGWVYRGNSEFKYFVDNIISGKYNQWYVMTGKQPNDYS